jgi:hypothetical protein
MYNLRIILAFAVVTMYNLHSGTADDGLVLLQSSHYLLHYDFIFSGQRERIARGKQSSKSRKLSGWLRHSGVPLVIAPPVLFVSSYPIITTLE